MATSKILEFITLFRAGQFKALWERPNIILRYGSFDPAKRAIALAKAGNLGDAVRALASEGVLDPKDHIEKLRQLHLYVLPPPAAPGPVPLRAASLSLSTRLTSTLSQSRQNGRRLQMPWDGGWTM